MGGMISLWAVTFIDFIQSLVTEHTQKESYMTRSNLIRLSGWLLIVGAISFLFGLIPVAVNTTTLDFYLRSIWNPFLDMVFIIGNFLAPILIGAGLLGLYAKFGNATGAGKYILLLGILIGIGTFIVIDLIQILTPGYVTLRRIHHYVFLGGAFFMFMCLTIFGIQMSIKRPLPKRNGLALTAGGIWVAVSPILVWVFSLHSFTKNWTPSFILVAGYIISTVALIMIGLDLQSNPNQEEAIT